MQTDPVQNEDDDTQPNNSYSEVSEKSYSSEVDQYGYPKDTDYPMKDGESYPKDGYKETYQGKDTPGSYKESYPKESTYPKDAYKDDMYKDATYKESFEKPKNYSKPDDYIPQTNEEYNKEAEKYALERKSHSNGYSAKELYQKQLHEGYPKLPDVYYDKTYPRESNPYLYQNSYQDSAEILRSQQHNLQMLQERQEQHRIENPNFFNENHIKQEIDITDDEKYMYERTKEQLGECFIYTYD